MKHVLNFLLGIPATLFGGFIFAKLWNWFFVRVFTSMPTLDMMDAVGLLMVLSWPLFGVYWAIAAAEIKKKDDSTEDLYLTLARLFIIYPFALGVAYAWHLVIR